jgi:hypothetical protein
MSMILWIERRPTDGSNVLKIQELQRMTMSGLASLNFKVQTSDCTGEKRYMWKSLIDCPRSCRRGWNIHGFMLYNFNKRFRNALGLSKICAKALDQWSETVMIFHLWKSPPNRKWRQKSFEKCHYRWQDMGLQLWRWNQTTILTLKESCFTSSQ